MKPSRRHFLKTAALSSVAVPNILRAQETKQKVRVGIVGIGQMGNGAVSSSRDEEIVAFCDVDWRDTGSDRSAFKISQKQPSVPKFNDFREMLEKKGSQIDAVLISTPDHTHFAAAMAAMEAGKHVFVQKPLAHNIWQVRTLQKAAKKYGVQTVMGNQGHCWEGIRLVKEWFEAGVLGDVKEVHSIGNSGRVPLPSVTTARRTSRSSGGGGGTMAAAGWVTSVVTASTRHFGR